MKLDKLNRYHLYYVGTPYTKYPGGIEDAFIEACRLTGELLLRGIKVYSPIAHTHPVAIHTGIDPLNLDVWLPFDAAMIEKSDAMIVAMMPSWRASTGVKHEIEEFRKARKPIYYLDPASMTVSVEVRAEVA